MDQDVNYCVGYNAENVVNSVLLIEYIVIVPKETSYRLITMTIIRKRTIIRRTIMTPTKTLTILILIIIR